jgi:hypothetical protein
MVSLANKEEQLRSRSLVELGRRTFWLLRFYERQKLSIPSGSKWFKGTYRHKDWLTASYSETSIAMSAGTVLSPDEVPDLMWFEDEVAGAITVSLEGLLSRKDLPNAYDFFASAQRTIEDLAKNYAVDEAVLLFRRVTPLIHQHAHKGSYPDPKDQENLDDLKFALALIDLHALSFINILLGFSEKIRNVTAESLASAIQGVRWQDEQGIYATGLPRKAVEQLEYLRRGLEFERSVEGRYISPVWYRLQNVAISFLRFMESVVKTLIPELEKITIGEVRTFVAEDRHLFAAQLIERGLEACNKFSYHFVEIERCWDRLADLRKMHDMPWPSIDWKEQHKRIDSIHEELVIAFSGLLGALATTPGSKELPDYFGHAYSVIAEECYAAMANGKEALFQKLFPAFFSASIEANQRCLLNPVSNDQATQFGYCAQPIVDLFDISGYSILFQELDGKKYWDYAKVLWDKYLDSRTDRTAVVKVLNALGNYQEFYMIFPRSVLRTSWEQELERRLRELGLMANEFDDPFSTSDKRTSARGSPIIRVLVQSGILLDEARKFFVAVYFDKEIEKGEIEASVQVKELREEIRKRSRINEERNGDD